MQPFRRVAIVEEFFDIIYNVHVGLGGRSGRHAGQKRTYRTITETYAFLPRDAVTRFLAGCSTCNNNNRTSTDSPRPFTPNSAGSGIGSATTATDRPSTDDAFTDSSSGAENGLDTQLNDADGMSVDLNVGQDLMNYYQLLRRMYEQTLAAQNARTTNVDPDADVDSTIDLTAGYSFTGQNAMASIADHPTPSCSPTIQDRLYPSMQNSNNSPIKPSDGFEESTSCQTTPPKKRFSRSFENGSDTTNELVPREVVNINNNATRNVIPTENNVNNNNYDVADTQLPKVDRSDWEPLADVKKNEFAELRSAKLVSVFFSNQFKCDCNIQAVPFRETYMNPTPVLMQITSSTFTTIYTCTFHMH